MNDKILSALEKVSEKEIKSLGSILIFPESKNSYTVYEKYHVKKNKKGSYTVTVSGTFTEKNFYKLKNAVAWCSFDKRNLFKDAQRLHDLDSLIWAMDTEIELHLSLIKSTKDDGNKLIYISKLSENRYKKHQYTKELNNFIQSFDRYQNNLFDRKPAY
jgi:hypothetical protein